MYSMIFSFLLLGQNNPLDLTIDKVVVINNEMSINITLTNHADESFVIYKPVLGNIPIGILQIKLVDNKDDKNSYSINPFDYIMDVDKVYLTRENTIMLNKGESYSTNIKIPKAFKNGKYKLYVGLHYADTNFEFKEKLPIVNLFDGDLSVCKLIKIK